MFACLYSLSVPITTLVRIAEVFTPRFEVVGPLVMLDVSGLSRLFGSPREIGEQLRRSAAELTRNAVGEGTAVRMALAPTQTAAALLTLGRAGLTIVMPGEEVDMLASLPVTLLGDFDRLRLAPVTAPQSLHTLQAPFAPAPAAPEAPAAPAEVPYSAPMFDALPYFESTLDRIPDSVGGGSAFARKIGGPHAPHAPDALAPPARKAPSAPEARYSACGGGWRHPRDSHAANATRQARRAIPISHEREHPHAASGAQPLTAATRQPAAVSQRTPRSHQAALAEIQALLDTLKRWGVRTIGAFAGLPSGAVYERLGARGVFWQYLARGLDKRPLVPWVPEDPFEGVLELEWPIEGLEPLSFVLGRLFEPLAERLERADRGAVVLHTHLRLVSKEVYARTLQLPAPMRDPKTLRTLVLLDLETNPPSAGINRVRVLVEPTPARVTQWKLFDRAQPSPEQVSTLLARLTALMGECHVGSPRLLDTWKPGAFEMAPFQLPNSGPQNAGPQNSGQNSELRTNSALSTNSAPRTPPAAARGPLSNELGRGHAIAASGGQGGHSALRRLRLPVPARVQVVDGRPVRVMTDRRGVTSGAIVQAAGPWRTSGEWWNDAHQPQSQPYPIHPTQWDRDEWDVALADGTVYRIFVEREVGQWFIEGVVD